MLLLCIVTCTLSLYFTVNISFFYVAGDSAGRPGIPTFVCTPGVNIELEALCNGVGDCANGDDETTTLCESMSTNLKNTLLFHYRVKITANTNII